MNWLRLGKPRDVGLREPELGGDFLLRAVEEEPQQHDLALPAVECAHGACDERPCQGDVVERLRPVVRIVVLEHEWASRGCDHRVAPGTHRPREADRGDVVAQVPAHLALHAPRHVLRQGLHASGITAVDRAHDRERADLPQVLGPLAEARQAPCQTVDERQVRLDELAPLRVRRSVIRSHTTMLGRSPNKWKRKFKKFFV